MSGGEMSEIILGWTIGGAHAPRVQFPAPSLETSGNAFDEASNTTAGAAVLPIPNVAAARQGVQKRGRNLDGGLLPNAATPKRIGLALRNSQFAMRNCQDFFSGFHFGMDDWGNMASNFCEQIIQLQNRNYMKMKMLSVLRMLRCLSMLITSSETGDHLYF